ncbi:ABATE domain-containing protein [Actinomadura macrotermitis]|uniref:Zinc finger CGNR domain-containing protein n=1 Tax=Actinomadura macrotermitis TaxID=2585200 RepID=A0A7K0C3V3_9ACTN|nr:CGNR zinc finger domain-containing protein [Actinomadura macrotermitis]MQY07484.1 hypothetical protein [Actinomadura macrotermitis]
MDDPLALRFASTIRATRSGLTDALDTPEGLAAWLQAQGLPPSDDHAGMVALRQAVRALFARAVAPAPPSAADASRLPPFPEALALVNAAAAPVVRRLDWTDGWQERTQDTAADARLAHAAIDFFAGPEVERVRACPAPRCVLYFIKRHPRQEWCSVACGNRARAARHYRRAD